MRDAADGRFLPTFRVSAALTSPSGTVLRPHDQQLAWPARSEAGGRRSGPSPAGQEPGATGNVHRAPRWQTTHQFDHPLHLGVPPRSIAIGEANLPLVPLVVVRGMPVVVFRGRRIPRERGQTRRHDRRTPPRAGSCPSQPSRSRTPILLRRREQSYWGPNASPAACSVGEGSFSSTNITCVGVGPTFSPMWVCAGNHAARPDLSETSRTWSPIVSLRSKSLRVTMTLSGCP